jgi:multidrug efflux pump subunit AcrB
MTILKAEGSSTLDVVSRVRAALPGIQAQLPPELKMEFLFDQSVFVRAAVEGVLREGAIAAGLTALMILLFLGSWRSTLIVATSIPLSILASVVVLGFMGESLNTMTLGGMALAVGILVDDATVELENVHRNFGVNKPIRRAILDGASQIATPAFVSTLSICIVFVPVLFLAGPAASLFYPLALAVVFAMLASYFLSRTLVPTMVLYMLPSEVPLYTGDEEANRKAGPIWRFHEKFDRLFELLRSGYQQLLAWALDHRMITVAALLCFAIGSVLLIGPRLGEDFFPAVDAGQFRLHVRAPSGTRIEVTEQVFGRVENAIRESVPASELATIINNMGLTRHSRPARTWIMAHERAGESSCRSIHTAPRPR